MRVWPAEARVRAAVLPGLLMVATLLVGCSRTSGPPETAERDVSARRETGPVPAPTRLDVKLPDIREAAEAGDVEAVKECLRRGASPYGGGMWDPIRLAAREGHAEVVDLLVEHGVRYDPEVALMLGRKDDVQEFLEGTPERERDRWERTLLDWAARSGRADMAIFLIDAGADVNAGDPGQVGPLHVVRTAEVAQILLDHGADVNARDAQEQTPLHRAQSVEIARLLIEHGAEIDAPARYGITPLMSAVSANRTECVKLLLEYGADPNTRNAMSGTTALHHAALDEDPSIARALLEHGARVNATDNRGNTPLRCLMRPREGRAGGPAEKVLRDWGGVECPHK